MNVQEVEQVARRVLEPDSSVSISAEYAAGYIEIVICLKEASANGPFYKVRTNGAEAFVSSIENGLSRIDFEYEHESQVVLVEQLTRLAKAHLGGRGVNRQRRTVFGRFKREVSLTVDDEVFTFT